jgi:DNA-binding CsgD family transcriptional regulator
MPCSTLPGPAQPWADDALLAAGLAAFGVVGTLANDEIAGRLVVSPATVRTHVSRAMTKLHARDRAQLVVFAYQSGLVGQIRSRPT